MSFAVRPGRTYRGAMPPHATDDQSQPGPAPDRLRIGSRSRLLGVAVLLAVLVAALGVPQLTRTGFAGHPSALPLPLAPPVGSCLLIDDQSVTTTSCDGPHHAEVTQTWEAGQTADGAPAFAALAAKRFGDPARSATACLLAQLAYLDYNATDASGNWNPVRPGVQGEMITAPAGAHTPTRGWTGCVLAAPGRGVFIGSLRPPGAARPIESRLASCLELGGAGDAAGWIGCQLPHRIEVLATFDPNSVVDEQGVYRGLPTNDELDQSCSVLVTAMTGVTDVTFGGLARIGATPLLPGSRTQMSVVDTVGSRLIVDVPLPLCFVELVGDGALNRTVIGLGDHPLPLV